MSDTKDEKKKNSLFDEILEHFGVLTDFTAMKFADIVVKVGINRIEKIFPQLAEKLIAASQTHPAQTEAFLVISLQVLGSTLLKLLPKPLRDIAEDFAAKLPTSVSLALKKLAEKSAPVKVEVTEKDLSNLKQELSQKLGRQAGDSAANAFSNFVFFTMLLDDNQLTHFYTGIQELDKRERNRLESIFSSMKPQQIEQILRRFPKSATIGKDWSILFGIFRDMGLLSETEEADVKEEKADPRPQEEEVLKTILSINDAVKRDKIIGFLAVFSTDKAGQYQLAIQRMAGWKTEDFSRFSELSTHQLMASLLGVTLPKVAADQEEKESFVEKILDKIKVHRDAGRQADIEQGRKLANQAMKVIGADPRLNGILPLFKSLAEIIPTE